MDFNGKFIVIKSLVAKDKNFNYFGGIKGEFENAILKEIYISADIENFEVYEKEYKVNI
jgi:hypothetical protein